MLLDLLNARGRATARLYELDELMLTMSSELLLRPVLEEVWVIAHGERKIFLREKPPKKYPQKSSRKIHENFLRNFLEKSPEKYPENDPKK